MKKQILLGAALVALAAVPAALGLWGNGSFAEAVPVPVPSPTPVVTLPAVGDDSGGGVSRDERDERMEPGDDRTGTGTSAPVPSAPLPSAPTVPAPAPTAPGVDDHGGDIPRDQRIEPGDGRGGVDDRRGGGDDGRHDSDDRGGHGSDD